MMEGLCFYFFQIPGDKGFNEKSLQELISILGNFCEEWGLVINFKKTKVMTFTRSGRLILPKLPIKIKDVIIEATIEDLYIPWD